MADYLERRVSKAAAWARRLASFSAVLFLTAGIGHRYGFLESPGFIAVLGVVAGLAILALAFAVRGFSRLWNYGDLGGRNLTVAGLVSLLVLAPFALSLYRGFAHPMLTDISTDLDDPPELAVAMKKRTAGMNAIAPFSAEKKKLQLDNYPLVTGRRYEMPFSRVVESLDKVLAGRGWAIASPMQATGEAAEATIEALAYTTFLGFPADVAIRITDEDISTYVDMRSTSRYGEHDLGDNAARITDFLAELDAEISVLAGVLPAEPAEADPEDAPVPEPRPQG